MADLQEMSANYHTLINNLQLSLNGMGYAAAERVDLNLSDDLIFEATFMRAYSEFEECLEKIFLHYSVGGQSLAQFLANTRLTNCDEQQARNIVKSDSRYLDWSSVVVVRDRAKRFFSDGEPFLSTHGASSDALIRAEKIRNRIAHCSPEAKSPFQDVLLFHFKTGRLFEMSPGQLLRTRTSKPAMHVAAQYLGIFAAVIEGLVRKPHP